MKTILFGLALTIAAPQLARAEAAAKAAPTAKGATVTIDLAGVQAAPGDLYVSLQTRAQFMKPTGSYGTIVRQPAAGSRTVTLSGVKPGDYAVSVWHDINGNKLFDRAENGKPLDGWAMLNGESLRSVPTFDQVDFVVAGTATGVKLEMHYGR